ncbi:hypothetical protein Tco_0303019 [Tanacetum coccineum]
MDTTKAQQITLDDALVAFANRLKIGKCNHRLSSTLKSNEPTPFYKAFQITADVPEIYMQELWATVSIYYNSLHFKMNNKRHTLNLENFRDMLQICPRLPGQKFEDPPFEEEILSFIRDLGHTVEIKLLTDVNKCWIPKAYKQYYTVASGAEPPKAKTKCNKKEDELVTPSKSKSAPAAKGIRLKTPGDGVDTHSKVPDKQQQKVTGTDEGASDDDDEDDDDKNDSEETESDNDADDFVHPNLSTYQANDLEEEEKADDDEVSSEQRVSTPLDYELIDEEENKEGDDKEKEGEHEQEEEDDLYRDVDINLERSDTEMIDAQANQEMDDAHVTLTAEPLSDSLVNVPVSVATETPSSVSIIPQLFFPNIQPQQQTLTSTTTTTNPTTTLRKIPNFASVFHFDQRVSALETKMSEFKQTNQFAEAVSSISSIVDNYLASKMKDAVDVAV